MKKILFLSLFTSFKMFGQSVTIVPSNYADTEFLKIKKHGIGLDHRNSNGVVGVGTYASDLGAGWIQTHTPHPLNFTTNNSNALMTLSYSSTASLNGNLGIGIFAAEEKLHVVGNIRTSSLAGTGNRQILADANGTLIVNTAVQTLSLPCYSFVSSDQSSFSTNRFAQYSNNFEVYGTTGNYYSLNSPINLPDGAKITEIRIRYVDNVVGKRLYFRIYRQKNESTGTDLNILSGLTTTSLQSTSDQFFTYTLPTAHVVDNATYHYMLLLYPYDDSISSSFWDGLNLRINNVQIKYTF